MNPVYKKLALILDTIPNGFPATQSGVELKILAKLFTVEEAEVACGLTLDFLSAARVAEKLDRETRETFVVLKSLVKKGLIELKRGEGQLTFALMPFVVGFYERQNAEIDEEFARLFEAYYRESLHKMMAVKPSVHRVIPVEATIPLHLEVMPSQRASFYLDRASSWGVLNCICRVQKKLIGEACEHSLENCLVMSTKTAAFERAEAIRSISREEAQEILNRSNGEGLVHSTGNVRDGVSYICNCCTCSCGILRGVAEFGNDNAVARSDFFAEVDAEDCTGCGLCTDRCQFGALKMADDISRVNRHHCVGCGLCVPVCPTDAITMVQKKAGEREDLPGSEEEWREKRQRAREQLFDKVASISMKLNDDI